MVTGRLDTALDANKMNSYTNEAALMTARANAGLVQLQECHSPQEW